MKKLLYTFVLILFSTIAVLAEDVIYFNNGNQQRGTVLEINSVEVKYKKADNPNGPTYVVNRSEVQMIEYSNGYKDIITDNSQNSNQNTQANNNNNYNNNNNNGRNQDTYINNYYSNPRPPVQVYVAPPAPVWGWGWGGYSRPYYYGGGGYYHHHHYHRGCR